MVWTARTYAPSSLKSTTKTSGSLVGSRRIVSGETDSTPRSTVLSRGYGTGSHRSTPVRPCDLLAGLAERWDYRLTPARLHALRPLSQGTSLGLDLQRSAGRNLARQVSSPISGRWKLPATAKFAAAEKPPDCGIQIDARPGEDELLRAAFAPDDRILDPAYIERSEDWQACSGGFGCSIASMPE